MEGFSSYYKIISLKENILLLCAGFSPGYYSIEVFNKSFSTIFIENYTISFDEISSIDIIQPKLEDKDFFFDCLDLKYNTTICNYGKFQNNQIKISSSYINLNYHFYLKDFIYLKIIKYWDILKDQYKIIC